MVQQKCKFCKVHAIIVSCILGWKRNVRWPAVMLYHKLRTMSWAKVCYVCCLIHQLEEIKGHILVKVSWDTTGNNVNWLTTKEVKINYFILDDFKKTSLYNLSRTVNIHYNHIYYRCLHSTGGLLQLEPGKVCRVVAACAVLHNIALHHRAADYDNDEGMEDEQEQEDEQQQEDEIERRNPQEREARLAIQVREQIIQQFFQWSMVSQCIKLNVTYNK